MPDDEKLGQETGTPTGDETGQISTDPPISDTDKVLNAITVKDKEVEEKVEPEPEKVEKKPEKAKEKPAPYDQDPKWKAARAAEKDMQEILKSNDFESIDDLKAALKGGKELSDVLGKRDANKLIEDANQLQEIKAYWAELEEKKKEEEEEPLETVERLKKENKALKKEQADEKAALRKAQEAEDALNEYNKIVKKAAIDSGEGSEMLEVFLGVNNPANEVDLSDAKAVKKMAKEGAEKFNKFLADIKQKAIDEYAAGKSEIIPISKDENAPPEIPDVKKGKENETIDEANADAKAQLMEMVNALND